MAMAMMYTVLFTRLGSNSLYRSTNCSCFSGLRAWASLYRYTRLRKCTKNWNITVRIVYRLKMLGRGRSQDRVLRGLDREMKRKQPASSSPCSVAWKSLNLTPSR